MAKKNVLFRVLTTGIPLLFIIPFSAAAGDFGDTTSPKTEFVPVELPEKHSVHLRTDEIRFEEEVVYSEPSDIMFGNIMTSAVDHSGQVLMGDNDQRMVHVFNPAGNYIQSFGSQGNGPGEFQMISKIAASHSYIHVFDMIMGRINIFDAHNFNFIRTVALSENGGRVQRRTTENGDLGRPFDFHLLTDGNYLVSFRSMMNLHRPQTAIISHSGEILGKNRFELPAGADEITESSSGNMRVVINFPFLRATGLTLSAGGILFTNWSEHLEFDLYNEDGTHIRTFSHPLQNAPMDRRELLKMYENRPAQGAVVMSAGSQSGGSGGGFPAIEQILQDTELPGTWPAVQSMYADQQNRLWVSSYTQSFDKRKWFLFDESGGLLGTFTWPASRRVIHTDQNTVYILDRPDDDLDTVIRYRFTAVGE